MPRFIIVESPDEAKDIPMVHEDVAAAIAALDQARKKHPHPERLRVVVVDDTFVVGTRLVIRELP